MKSILFFAVVVVVLGGCRKHCVTLPTDQEAYLRKIMDVPSVWTVPTADAELYRGRAMIYLARYAQAYPTTDNPYVVRGYAGTLFYLVTLTPYRDSVEIITSCRRSGFTQYDDLLYCIYTEEERATRPLLLYEETRHEKLLVDFMRTGTCHLPWLVDY